MPPRLFHFSHDPAIDRFIPRPAPAERPPGREWLNDPLVWAIDESRQAMYLFPRECPRILLWPAPTTAEADRERWFGNSSARVIAHIEWEWLDRLRSAVLYRYELPPGTFEDLRDAGMWVSHSPVTPVACVRLDDLPAALAAMSVELRLLPSLAPLANIWSRTTLHVSGVRLRNARGWPAD